MTYALFLFFPSFPQGLLRGPLGETGLSIGELLIKSADVVSP